MTESDDAIRLRDIWNEENLGRFEGQWIAFKNGEVETVHAELGFLLESYAPSIREGLSPIFAFVWFKGFQ